MNYVITGGPGVGKTSLLHALADAGFHIIPEDARRIIKEQLASGGTALPWADKLLYAHLMLKASIESYRLTIHESTFADTFFDRGVLDAVCYMRMENLPITDELLSQINQCVYANPVFILPPWKEIYAQDSERKQSWEEALYTFEKMRQTYLDFGYEVIVVPKDTLERRVQFVLAVLRG